MKQLVGIKGNPYGITLRLNENAPFESILEELDVKLKSSTKFFRNASVALKIENRMLSEEEEEILINHIEEISGVQVACILDDSKETTEYYQSMLQQAEEMKQELLNSEAQQEQWDKEKVQEEPWMEADRKEGNQGQFYKGTLRSGQVVESESSIIILGDINPGAKVVARGNIVVLGSLKGYAFAGAGGNDTAFVVALEMKPMQIRIGHYFGVETGKRERRRLLESKKRGNHPKLFPSEPKIAFVSEEAICIEPLSRDIMSDIRYT